MTHLLRIHIGPVQEFIAAARRSRDLWFGSWLLSELSKAAALAVAQREAAGLAALIFPSPADLAALMPDTGAGPPFNVANEITALIDGDPTEVAGAARDAVDARRDALVADTFATLRPYLAARGTWDVAEAQLKAFIEFYWAAVPYDGDYPAARAMADRLLAARKNTRTFDPVGRDLNWPKSSLDGARESVIPEAETRDADTMYDCYKARRGEHLSGVDLLKRLGNAGGESRFPSTSHMAAMPLSAQLADNAAAVAAAWNTYLSALPPPVKDMERAYHDLRLPVLGEQDGSLLFASRLIDYLEKDALRQAEKALGKFFEDTGIDKPNPYYALLVGDGDFMGRTINALPTPDANRAFSRALAGFATQARVIVRNNDGAVVYAGGDDVLALLPLHTAVACAAELAQTFATVMAGYGTAEGAPTFSAGIAIVHHLEPLEDALDLARRAEKEAKAISGKNALAVALDKRSGVPRMVSGKWGALDKRLLNLAALHQQGVIPDRMAYQMLDTYHLLGGRSAIAADASLVEVLGLESARIIERKRVTGGQAGVDRAHKDYIHAAIQRGDTTVDALADELVIAALLGKVGKIARRDFAFTPEEATSG